MCIILSCLMENLITTIRMANKASEKYFAKGIFVSEKLWNEEGKLK